MLQRIRVIFSSNEWNLMSQKNLIKVGWRIFVSWKMLNAIYIYIQVWALMMTALKQDLLFIFAYCQRSQTHCHRSNNFFVYLTDRTKHTDRP